MDSRITRLPNGKFHVVDNDGYTRVCDTVYQAEKYLWSENIGTNPRDFKYRKSDLATAPSPIRDFIYWLENGSDDELDIFFLLHPDFEFNFGNPLTDNVDEYFKRTASWNDVVNKGLGFLNNKSVYVKHMNKSHIGAIVNGWHGKYDTYVTKYANLYKRNDWTQGWWFCTCGWGQWCNSGHRPHDGPDSWGSVKVNNRLCSHAYALYRLLYNYRKHGDDKYLTPETAPVLF